MKKLLGQPFNSYIDGGEQEAADIFHLCSLENCEVVGYWMDGSEQRDGFSIVLQGPRMAYDILSRHDHPLRKEILFAFKAVLPSNTYIKTLRIHAVTTPENVNEQKNKVISMPELKNLIQMIEAQKELMIEVATGGPKIKDVNGQFQKSRFEIHTKLQTLGIEDPNTYLIFGVGTGSGATGVSQVWQARRNYIGNFYLLLLDALGMRKNTTLVVHPQEPTDWSRLDRSVDKVNIALVYGSAALQKYVYACR